MSHLNKKTLFLHLIVLFLGAKALSVEISRERTQYFWQPLKGLGALTLSAGALETNYLTEITGGDTSTYLLIPTYSVIYAFGLTQNWSFGLNLSTSPTEMTTTAADGTVLDSSTGGPNNLAVSFKNTTPFSKWNLHYGLTLSLSFDVNQPTQAGAQGNNFSGGDGLTPYAGTSYNIFGKSFIGFKGEYFYQQPRTVDPNRGITGARQKYGGNEVVASAFFEWHQYPWLIDFSGSYIWADTEETTLTTTQTTTSPFTTQTQNLGIEFFFNHQIMARLVASLTEVSQIAGSLGTIDARMESGGTFILRDEF